MIQSDPLREVELLAMLEEASTPLRHDVRNRIASIRNLAFFVRRKLSKEVVPGRDPRVSEFLSKIESEVQRTDEVIDSWSARVQSARVPEVGRVPVSQCLRLALECARLSSTVSLQLDPPRDEPEVEADGRALAFAVRCLLENAGEALDPGVVRVSLETVADSCRITVTDLGPGIVDAEHCLERFQTTKSGHLGLGLCMARRVASRLGGELVFGTPSVGAEVSLVLPLAGTRSASSTR